MEIILTQDVDNLGMAGQVLKVSAGYARNYLLPGSLALAATPNNLRTLAKKRAEFEKRALEAREYAQSQKKLMEGLVLSITRKSVDKGKLYGAVTPQDLVDAATEQGFTLDRRKLKISEPIKAIGDYDITVRLHPEVTGSFKVKILAEPKPEPEPVPEPSPDARRGRGRRNRYDDDQDYERPTRPRSLRSEDRAPEAAAEASAPEASPEPSPEPQAPPVTEPGPDTGSDPEA
jgi:large subunit ribosomal protein L9